jgi:hypothetical protein
VKIATALAAELDVLTQSLDGAGTDLAESMTRLAADARTAVGSYLGLSMQITVMEKTVHLTMLDEDVDFVAVRTSLFLPLSAASVDGTTTQEDVALILYAATPGAFIDLAADLAWITGQEPADFRLDEHRNPDGVADSTTLAALSHINQALGALIGQGSTPEQAERDLHARAAHTSSDLAAAAMSILAALNLPRSDAGGL